MAHDDADDTTAPDVLELRVHGVNNTTAASLLDLRPQDVELVAGDKLGSFWRPTASALDGLTPGKRGYVPEGIQREAYSWGGMVRTTPDVGSVGAGGVVAGVAARVIYALILPFSLANAAQWSWRLSPDSSRERGVRRFAGATRLFGVLLTLLFTCTGTTIALDVGALQCAADPTLCAPVAELFAIFEPWTAGQRLALFALVPVGAVLALWMLSEIARVRYDVLPGMPPAKDASASGAADADPTALLARRGFWSNRSTAPLARLHLAAAVLLTVLLTAGHAAIVWNSDCNGLGVDDACLSDAPASGSFRVFASLAVVAAAGLLTTLVFVFLTPTTTIVPDDDGGWGARWSRFLLFGSLVLLGALLLALLFDRSGSREPGRLYGAGVTPLVIVSLAALIAASGVFWRPRRDRRHTAWNGCGPGVLMAVALAIGTATSSIVVVTAGDFLNGAKGAAALVRDAAKPPGTAPDLVVSSCWVALGAAVTVGLVVALVWAGLALAGRRDVTARARAWGAPAGPDDIHVIDGGVLPPSPKVLYGRIEAKRRFAARAHLAEPLGAIVTLCMSATVVVGCVWAWSAYAQHVSLWGVLPWLSPHVVRTFLAVALPALAWIGLGLVAALALGAATRSSRPLGMVWDIVCYLPRTGHPFGPPSYAVRAVPEIAGRLVDWLDGAPSRRAVLSAHSMGAVLSVSALGVLASTSTTRPYLARISLLTFGVQLRAFFGRLVPELLGPAELDTQPCLAPRVRAEDPWHADFVAQGGASEPAAVVDPLAAAARRTTGPDAVLGAGPTSRRSRRTAADDLAGATASGAAGSGGIASGGATTPSGMPVGCLQGALLPPGGVPWVSLWRPTDYLGFPAMSTARAHPGFRNEVDRIAEELDLSGYMVEVGTHGEYYRVAAYDRALRDLTGLG